MQRRVHNYESPPNREDFRGYLGPVLRRARFEYWRRFGCPLPPENATLNYVKVVRRVPVKIVSDQGQDPQHPVRPGMSVEPKVRVK